MMQNKILIIGGNGFIGSHLIDGLLEKDYKVRVFDITLEKFRKPNSKIDYRISYKNNIYDLLEAMIGIDIVIHLAGTTVPSSSNIDLIADVNNNLITSLNILNLCVRQGIKKVVHFSSGGAVYGNSDVLPIEEDHKKNPISSYGIIKSTIESYVQLHKELYGLDYLIIRPSNPYGPRQSHTHAQGVISTFIQNAYRNEPLQIFGNGTTRKDYIYIKDLVDITIKLLEFNSIGIFNIGSGKGTSLNEIVQTINKTLNLKTEVIYSEERNYDVKNFILNINKIRQLLGYDFEFTSLENGINLTKEWIFQNRILN